MEKKHDDVSEALMRRRHDFAKGAEKKSEPTNRGEGEIAPKGAMPIGMAGEMGDAAPGAMAGEAVLTPEMFMQLLGSSNAGGLRGAVMQNAAAMSKKC